MDPGGTLGYHTKEMWQRLVIASLCTFKFGVMLPVAFAALDFWDAYIWVNIGGAAGVFATAHLADRVLPLWRRHAAPRIRRVTGGPRRPSRKRIRRLAKIKRRFGFPGIVILNPILLSIPVSTVITVHLFPNIRGKLLYLILGMLAWSLILGDLYSMVWAQIEGASHSSIPSHSYGPTDLGDDELRPLESGGRKRPGFRCLGIPARLRYSATSAKSLLRRSRRDLRSETKC